FFYLRCSAPPELYTLSLHDALPISNDRQTIKQIDGVRNVRYQPIVRRVEMPGPITFARGLEITVLLDEAAFEGQGVFVLGAVLEDRKSTRLNSSHLVISYAVFCLKK